MPNRHETLTSLFTDIANAIRNKTGGSADIKADDFDTAIEAIPTGGGGGSDDYFYVEPNRSSFIRFVQIGTVDVDIKYSTNKETWTDYNWGDQVTISENEKLYIKNTKDTFSLNAGNYVRFEFYGASSTMRAKVGGRILSLVNNIDGKACPPYSFYNLFDSCINIEDASDLKLPTILTSYCCAGMFSECTSLTITPSLSSKILADNCYFGMFDRCYSLTTAPDLPATTLETSCYAQMFQSCSALTIAPSLPATTLANYCYANMFNGCTALTIAPSLPATQLAAYCYEAMFGGCFALTTAPSLPATTLANYCYRSMFSNCTSLTTVPNLPATTLATSSYMYMFQNCSALKVYSTSGEGHDKAWSIPSTGALTATRSMNSMFTGVETDNVPANWPGAAGTQYTYYTQNDPV